MMTKKHDTRWMVSVALMAAIVIVLANTPLGMIQLPIIKATTVHIPVIIGAILLGPLAGGILGFVFGVCSLISNTMAPTLLSFAFSPFLSTTGLSGALKAIWISVGCRILIGVAAGWLWILFRKLNANRRMVQIIAWVVVSIVAGLLWELLQELQVRQSVAISITVFVVGTLWLILKEQKMNQVATLIITGFVGSMVNTIAVMGSIYLLFAKQYAEAKEVAVTAVWGLVMGTVTASGIPEAVAAAIIVAVVTKVLLKIRIVHAS